METEHRLIQGDSRKLKNIKRNSVDLVVTSPPYPMIEMWDDVFSKMNSEIETSLNEENAPKSFELMHKELDKCWERINTITNEDAIICINIGDATRKMGGGFEMHSNHSRIINKFREMGFSNLPNILWKKPTNSAAKFMGSGMIPPNAYVTLEHEHILIFRKNGTRNFKDSSIRYESAYFWEERNKWFSDTWSDVLGISQELPKTENRSRAAAYPLEIPLRLIYMFSVHGDTVLDPFMGTGTTNLAAAFAGRNSIGVDLDSSLVESSKERLFDSKKDSKHLVAQRLLNHVEHEKSNNGLNYKSENFDFTVTTKQEKELKPYIIKTIKENSSKITIEHEEFTNQMLDKY